METFSPLFLRSLPREAAVIPFPREDTTPPVTKMNFVRTSVSSLSTRSQPFEVADFQVHLFDKSTLYLIPMTLILPVLLKTGIILAQLKELDQNICKFLIDKLHFISNLCEHLLNIEFFIHLIISFHFCFSSKGKTLLKHFLFCDMIFSGFILTEFHSLHGMIVKGATDLL